jgi:hypothetical protein
MHRTIILQEAGADAPTAYSPYTSNAVALVFDPADQLDLADLSPVDRLTDAELLDAAWQDALAAYTSGDVLGPLDPAAFERVRATAYTVVTKAGDR